ncbi:hypothetical protein I4U23_009728 [Adineta vaga]|nr:hypothetical protein I4U23_009728 [Adineta vaga]
MNYLTGIASGPVFEFPYSGSQLQATPYYNNDIDAILASITPGISNPVIYQPPTFTLNCVPQISPTIGNNAIVYQVPEDVPIETVLQQFGIDVKTLQSSNSLNNYYRSVSQPMDVTIQSSPHRRRRRLICQEVSDSEDDNIHRRLSHHHNRPRHHSGPSHSQQAPPAIHNLLGKVWDKVKTSSERLPPSSSAPNLNWQSGQNRPPSPPRRPPSPPHSSSVNNVWQAMRNSPSPVPQMERNAVSNAWNRAANSNDANSNRLASMFNRMRQPTGGIVHSPPPMQNREAVHDFLALRNLPPGINQPQQNREAVNDFYALRNLPPGINQPPPPSNREATNNFLAARHIPFGINQPQQNREAVNDFYALRNLPPGINQPPANREAVNNFIASRNLPPSFNQSNPAVGNVWSRADYAAHNLPQSPPMMPPMNNAWNRMSSRAPFQQQSTFPFPPHGVPSRPPGNVPAPTSISNLLSQAHRQNFPYSGSAY